MSNKMSNKESVRLRQRTTKSGISLYLDIYRNGQRKYEYLKLYLTPEKNREAKEKNRQTLRLAEAIRSKRNIELLNDEYGFRNKREGVLFYPFAREVAEQTQSTMFQMRSLLKHIAQYDHRQNLTFDDITPRWVEGFVKHLSNVRNRHTGKPLRPNTKVGYYGALKAIINKAIRKDIITTSPLKDIEGFKKEDVEREYLTIDEVRTLAATPCDYPGVKRAFLFACLTGLRRSDIDALRWGEVRQQGQFPRIIFRQKKTKGQEYLDITPQAAELLGERRGDEAKVFDHLPAANHANEIIRRWVLSAGIHKDITFHCARHSFAIMMLELDTDIYTVSKLLGHRELATTQIYARVLDKKKQKAVANIPNIL